MKIGMTRNAKNLFEQGEYSEALIAYKNLAKVMGNHLFKANIAICKTRLETKKTEVNELRDVINVVFITDDNFALPTFVALHSLINNSNSNYKYNVNIVGSNINNLSVKLFKGLELINISIIVHNIKKDNTRFKIKKDGFHVSTAAILKFDLPNIIPNINKVLYLDSDIIINSDLVELFNLNIDNKYAAVVPDIKPVLKYKPSILVKLNINSHKHYFNTGVMLLNLKEMRLNNVTKKLFDYRENGINFFMDQDSFNVVFADNVKYLSFNFNLLMNMKDEFSIDEIIKGYKDFGVFESFNDLIKHSHIIHYASKNKPWVFLQDDYSQLWNRYYISSGANNHKFMTLHEVQKIDISNVIISLTSYPARIETVHLTIQSLLNQKFKVKKIILWLALDQFPAGEDCLPGVLLNLVALGLTIKWCQDIKSYKKLIPSMDLYPSDIIITVDDDIIYNDSLVDQLLASYIQHPASIHCNRGHKAIINTDESFASYRKWPRNIKNLDPSQLNFFTGCGGVLYPPSSLHNDVKNETLFMTHCPHGDDIWFWGMAVLNGTTIRIVPENDFNLNFTPDSQEIALWKTNDTGGENDVMLKNISRAYPLITTTALKNQ